MATCRSPVTGDMSRATAAPPWNQALNPSVCDHAYPTPVCSTVIAKGVFGPACAWARWPNGPRRDHQGGAAVDLPATSPWAAMIDHVLACLTGHAGNLIDPASALPALELTWTSTSASPASGQYK
jgi:hypothetical protein